MLSLHFRDLLPLPSKCHLMEDYLLHHFHFLNLNYTKGNSRDVLLYHKMILLLVFYLWRTFLGLRIQILLKSINPNNHISL
jgi:hypothetical protein